MQIKDKVPQWEFEKVDDWDFMGGGKRAGGGKGYGKQRNEGFADELWLHMVAGARDENWYKMFRFFGKSWLLDDGFSVCLRISNGFYGCDLVYLWLLPFGRTCLTRWEEIEEYQLRNANSSSEYSLSNPRHLASIQSISISYSHLYLMLIISTCAMFLLVALKMHDMLCPAKKTNAKTAK